MVKGPVEVSVGKHMLNYDSMVVLTHFKGHLMGGFGGSLKNIAIGCADGPIGKKMVHAAPDNEDYASWLKGEPFMENMWSRQKLRSIISATESSTSTCCAICL